jgi:hypothetical protein
MKIEDMAFDIDGRPLPHAPTDVRKMIMGALEDPDSQLVAVILRKGDELMIQVLGPPSRETLKQLEHVLKTAITGYRGILRGQ